MHPATTGKAVTFGFQDKLTPYPAQRLAPNVGVPNIPCPQAWPHLECMETDGGLRLRSTANERRRRGARFPAPSFVGHISEAPVARRAA